MEERIGLVSVKRAISLVVKASEITDHLRETLMVAISDFEHYLKMKRERFNSAFTYIAVVYLSFGVYLYTALELNTRFVSSFAKFDVALDIAGNTTDMFHVAIISGGRSRASWPGSSAQTASSPGSSTASSSSSRRSWSLSCSSGGVRYER